MYTVCYWITIVSQHHIRSAVRSKRLLGVPVRTRASHAHWPVPRGPHSPQPFLGPRRPELWVQASLKDCTSPASKLSWRIPGILVSNSVESRRDVFAGVGPPLCRTQLRKPGWLGLGLGTVGSFCGRIARTVTVSSTGMLAGADGATAIFNFTVNVGALAENDYRRDRS